MAPKSKNRNPVLEKLGYGPKDRVVVLHADDIGMCAATLPAYDAALEFGVLSSAAVMVPCPWFPAMARLCREQAGNPRLDVGVHLTLNAEWQEYRWGPISTRDPASGLLDADGYFPRLAAPVAEHAVLDALELELRAQIDRALAAGIDVTHIDSHMFTLMHPRFLPIYFKLGFEYGLPAFMIRDAEQMFSAANLEPNELDAVVALLADVQARGMALFDDVVVMPLDESKERVEHARKLLKKLPAGLSNFIVHPAAKSSELRALAPDWKSRVADAELFVSKEWRKAVADAGVQVIGFRTLSESLRASIASAPAPA